MSRRSYPENEERMLQRIRDLIQPTTESGKVDFQNKWLQVLDDFAVWTENLPAEISHLTSRLELLRRLSRAFPDYNLTNCVEVLTELLRGTPTVGERIWLPELQSEVEIVRRQITSDFRLLYTLIDSKGQPFQRDLMD